MNIRFPAGQITAPDHPGCSASHHRGIVGAKGERWKRDRHLGTAARRHLCQQSLSEPLVGGDAASQDDRPRAELPRRVDRLHHERVDDGFLKGGGEIGDGSLRTQDRRAVLAKRPGCARCRSRLRRLGWRRPIRLDEAQKRRLEPGETEVVAAG